MLSNWIHNLFYNGEEERNNVNILNKQVKDLYKPCVLTQGQRLHNNQAEKINALRPNLLAFNEPITPPYTNTSPFVNTNTYAQYNAANTYANGDRYNNANTYATTNTYIKGSNYPRCIEGFGPIETTAKNTAEWQDTTNLSNDYSQKIDRYATEYPTLLAHGRLYSQATDRNTNYKENTLSLNKDINVKYNITADKEGCYKQAAGSDLLYQSDIKDVTLDTCKKRASDLAYAGFSIKSKTDGKLGCYLTNDVAGNKTAGIATRPQTSLAFKSDKSANIGGLLMNGQLGIFQDTKTLATDLTAVPGCNVDGSKILINPDTVVATWGGNCANNIKSELNYKCIDQSNGSKDPYLQMQMWDCGQGNPNQNMVYNSDSQTINVPGDNLCMDVLGAGTADGTKVIQYSCNGGSNQKWTYGIDKTLQPQNAPGKCLDLLNSNNANGAVLGIWDCNGGTNQKWDITRNGVMFAPIPPQAPAPPPPQAPAPAPPQAPAPAPAPAPTGPPAKNAAAIGFINAIGTYLDQILTTVQAITAANNQAADNYGLASYNYTTITKQQLSAAIAAINSNNYSQAIASINSAITNINNAVAFCVTSLVYINANQTTKDYVTGIGTNATQNANSAINALNS